MEEAGFNCPLVKLLTLKKKVQIFKPCKIFRDIIFVFYFPTFHRPEKVPLV